MKSTTTSFVVIVVGLLVAGSIFLFSTKPKTEEKPTVNNVSVVEGVQIVEITARGGYQPQTSTAEAGIPTVIRFVTNGTFDCSSSIRIPSLNITKVLPRTGTTDVDLGAPLAGTLQGSCGMGMYPFEVVFR